jgi:hypothetical protein
MDIKQRIQKVLDSATDREAGLLGGAVECCRDALAEIERLEAAARHNPYKVNLRDAPTMSFREANGFGGTLTDTQRIERIERFLNEFIASNR